MQTFWIRCSICFPGAAMPRQGVTSKPYTTTVCLAGLQGAIPVPDGCWGLDAGAAVALSGAAATELSNHSNSITASILLLLTRLSSSSASSGAAAAAAALAGARARQPRLQPAACHPYLHCHLATTPTRAPLFLTGKNREEGSEGGALQKDPRQPR